MHETPEPSRLHSHQKSQSSKKRPFGYTSRIDDDDEEDSFQMIADASGKYGKNDATVSAYGLPSRDSQETILPDKHRHEQSGMAPIRVDREWRIESRTPERIFP